ncbi:SAV_915 family protein [Streptomyces sp. ODS28]|uniref:SAV_915 family protein n=1 Tax=Streptomyces sp. ODS28 TaxID=3136688 RepID=UPI0031EC2DB8
MSDEEAEPCERVPAGPLCVPVRPGPGRGPGERPHTVAVRLFRTPLGERTAVGFTTPRRLAATLGASQEWIEVSEPALRALAAPLGARTLTVDPQFAAPAPEPSYALRAAAERAADAMIAGLGLGAARGAAR